MSALNNDVETSWFALEQINDEMRSAASQLDWPQVVELAVGRHKRLLNHFERFPVGPENAAFYQHHLTRMLAGEKELQALALDARKRVMRDGAGLSHSKKAMGAYLSQ